MTNREIALAFLERFCAGDIEGIERLLASGCRFRGREGDWFRAGLSPRKQALTLYIMSGFSRYKTLVRKLGPHKTGKSCLYIKRLSDVDLDVLTELIRESVKHPMGGC